MKRSILFVTVLIAACHAATAQDNQAKVVCDKLPYRLGHIVYLNSTDLRDHARAATKKELKAMGRKIAQIQAECNAFVSTSPGHAVAKDVSYTVKGFAAYYERCESFCGTEKDLSALINKEADEPVASHK